MSDFNDWTNPTIEEIKKWAYNSNSMAPEQDFALMLAMPEYIVHTLELVLDKNCPKRNFFLQTLYMFAGDAIRRMDKNRLDNLKSLLEDSKNYNDEILNIWIKRVETLMSNPNQLNYFDWYDNPKLAGVNHW